MQPDQYLDRNILHFSSLSNRLFTGIRFVGIAIDKASSPDRFHGRIVRFISKAIVASGYVLNSGLALTEAVFTLSIGLIAATVHMSSKAKFEFLQKYTIKCLSYGTESLTILSVQISLLWKRQFPNSHLLNTIVNHGIYLGSAATTQIIFGSLFDHIAGRNSQDPNATRLSFRRVWFLALEDCRGFFQDALHAIERDFRLLSRLRATLNTNISFTTFIQQRPEHAAILSDLNITNLLTPTYRARLINFVGDLMPQIAPNFAQITPNPRVVVLGAYQVDDAAYQLQLQENIKRAYKDIHRHDVLAQCLAEDNLPQTGRDALEGFYGEIYVPIANLAQFYEIENPVMNCPAVFQTTDLLQFNARRGKIETAQKLLSEFSQPEKELLILKLLKGSSFTFPVDANPETIGKINTAFPLIVDLAGSLHQGKLMTQLTFNLDDVQATSNSLFQKACQDASTEIQAIVPVPT